MAKRDHKAAYQKPSRKAYQKEYYKIYNQVVKNKKRHAKRQRKLRAKKKLSPHERVIVFLSQWIADKGTLPSFRTLKREFPAREPNVLIRDGYKWHARFLEQAGYHWRPKPRKRGFNKSVRPCKVCGLYLIEESFAKHRYACKRCLLRQNQRHQLKFDFSGQDLDYVVYYLPENHRAGATARYRRRLYEHQSLGHFTEGAEIVFQTNNLGEASAVEKWLHDHGYNGEGRITYFEAVKGKPNPRRKSEFELMQKSIPPTKVVEGPIQKS